MLMAISWIAFIGAGGVYQKKIFGLHMSDVPVRGRRHNQDFESLPAVIVGRPAGCAKHPHRSDVWYLILMGGMQ
ncbi:hypothetical protein DSUL_60073 [Desulfovibrionales bacterium]